MLSKLFPNPKKSFFRPMNPTLTYSPKFTSTNIGEYRYFFNGQEGDNEVFGEMTLHAFEFRMHNARLGRFWSVDPLAAKYPWIGRICSQNTTYNDRRINRLRLPRGD